MSLSRKRSAAADNNDSGDPDFDIGKDGNLNLENDSDSDNSQYTESESCKQPRLDDADENTWNEMFDILIHFGIQHNTCNVPRNYVTGSGSHIPGCPLGAWLAHQLDLQRSNSLRSDRHHKLQVICAPKYVILVLYIAAVQLR